VNEFKQKIYKIQKINKWRLQYQLDGKRIRKNFDSKTEAVNYFEEIKMNYLYGGHETIADHVEIYLKLYPGSKMTKTAWILESFLSSFGIRKPFQVTPSELRDWLLMCRKSRRLTMKSVSNYKAHIAGFFKYLTEKGIIALNPLANVSFSTKEESPATYSEEYWEALYMYSPYLLYRVKWLEVHTGLSRKAVLSLKWSDSLDRFDTKVRTYIMLLPRKSVYVLVNRKGKKIDSNLIGFRMKRFEERFHALNHLF
jgi:integrase